MTRENALLQTEEIKLLTEIGFVAAGRGDVKHATIIFAALQRLRPQRAFAYVGQALALMNALRHDEAAVLLDRAAEHVLASEQAELNVFRGLALQLAGRSSESVRALQAASSLRIARMMLGLE